MTGNDYDVTDPASMTMPTLRAAARRFAVQGRARLPKAELIEALEHTAWSPAAETPHTCIREHHPERGQPKDSCALCFRSFDEHPSPVPRRFGWPAQWAWQFGEPFPG